MTATVDIIRPVTNIILHFQLTHTTSDRMLHNYTVDFCETYGNFPPHVHLLFEFFKSQTGDLIHECPFSPKRNFGLVNFPCDDTLNAGIELFGKIMKMYPGDYLAVICLSDNRKKLIFFGQFFAVVTPVTQKRLNKKGKV